MSAANGLEPALDLVLPTLEDAEPEPEQQVQPNLEVVAGKSHELLDAVAAALHSQIAMEQIAREEFEEQVKASKVREQQMKRTLATIEAQADAAEKREQRETRVKGARKPGWTPSEEKLAEVWAGLLPYAREHGEFTIHAVTDAIPGISGDVVRKAVPIYRERELVRLLAKKVKGGGRAWALMPDAEQRGAELWHAST